MWSIYARLRDGEKTLSRWTEMAGGYSSPQTAAKDLTNVRQAWPNASTIMVGMTIWSEDDD